MNIDNMISWAWTYVYWIIKKNKKIYYMDMLVYKSKFNRKIKLKVTYLNEHAWRIKFPDTQISINLYVVY